MTNSANPALAPGNRKGQFTPVDFCPNCSQPADKSPRHVTDWQHNGYVICSGCGCWFQNPKVEIPYEEHYWGTIKDPDGNVRDLTTERDARIRNLYCETIPFVNHLSPGKNTV